MIGRRIVPFGVVALLLAGCAESPDVAQGPQAPAGSVTPRPTAPDALVAAAAEWKDFPAKARSRPLLVLVDEFGGGFKTSEAKEAFYAGRWRAPEDLPPTPQEFGGYPVIDAADALEVLRREQSGGRTEGSELEVVKVRLVTVPDVVTDRGPADLPAWRVDFDKGSAPWFVVATAEPARYSPKRVAESFYNVVGEVTDTELTVRHLGSADSPGGCGADYRIEAFESDTAVAYRVVEVERPAPEPSEEPVECASMLYGRETPLTLEKPIGNRVLLNVFDGRVEPSALVDSGEFTHPAMG
ncbi:MAG: hypothetical protein ACT4QF_16030 [Sporichthyaceae bacterium]